MRSVAAWAGTGSTFAAGIALLGVQAGVSGTPFAGPLNLWILTALYTTAFSVSFLLAPPVRDRRAVERLLGCAVIVLLSALYNFETAEQFARPTATMENVPTSAGVLELLEVRVQPYLPNRIAMVDVYLRPDSPPFNARADVVLVNAFDLDWTIWRPIIVKEMWEKFEAGANVKGPDRQVVVSHDYTRFTVPGPLLTETIIADLRIGRSALFLLVSFSQAGKASRLCAFVHDDNGPVSFCDVDGPSVADTPLPPATTTQ